MDDYDFDFGDYFGDSSYMGDDSYSLPDYELGSFNFNDYLNGDYGYLPTGSDLDIGQLSDLSSLYSNPELMQGLDLGGYNFASDPASFMPGSSLASGDIASYLSQTPGEDLAAQLGAGIGDSSTKNLIAATLNNQSTPGMDYDIKNMLDTNAAVDTLDAEQQLAKLSKVVNPMEGFATNVWSGRDLSKPVADQITMGMAIDPWTGKSVDSAGMSGITAFDPTYGNDITDLGFLDENTARLYGLDQSLATGTGGWGGATGTGKGFNKAMPSGGSLAQLARDANTTESGKAAAKAASEAYQKENPTEEELTTAEKVKTGLSTAEKVKTGLSAANMAALAAALLAGGDKKSPGSSQGNIGANAWEIARMQNRGKAVKKAEGGLASIKEAIQKMMGGKGKPAAVVKKEEYIVPPTPEAVMEGSGLLQNAARSLGGRQRQLELLEQEAVGKKAGGRLYRHASGGQADSINAMLSGGEYVMDADIVSALGDGNTEAGAAKLDEMREAIRQHKRSAPKKKIPPKAKSPLEYMKGR